MVVESAIKESITGAGRFTVTVVYFIDVPVVFFAVSAYVVETVGVTIFEVVPSTEPTPLSMLKLVAGVPERVHDKVEDWP